MLRHTKAFKDISTYIHIYTYTIHTYMQTCRYVNIQIRIHAYMYVSAYMCMYMYVYIYMLVYLDTCAYIHICMYLPRSHVSHPYAWGLQGAVFKIPRVAG